MEDDGEGKKRDAKSHMVKRKCLRRLRHEHLKRNTKRDLGKTWVSRAKTHRRVWLYTTIKSNCKKYLAVWWVSLGGATHYVHITLAFLWTVGGSGQAKVRRGELFSLRTACGPTHQRNDTLRGRGQVQAHWRGKQVCPHSKCFQGSSMCLSTTLHMAPRIGDGGRADRPAVLQQGAQHRPAQMNRHVIQKALDFLS